MASPTFGLFGGGNGAPNPPVFAGTNPTGGSTNINSTQGSTFPNFGLFNGFTPNTGPFGITGGPNPLFNGGAGSPLASLSTGFGDPYGNGNMLREFQRAYGKGTGALLNNIMTKGLFNPQVAAAFLNAMQPGIARGEGNILNAFGAEGSRFGSAAALGLGDFESQVNLNENQTLASMYMQAQQEQLGLLNNSMSTLHAEEANSGGFWSDLLGGLEIAGGIIGAPFTGGATLPLVGAGIGTLSSGLSHGSSGGGGSNSGLMSGISGFGKLFNNGNQSNNQDNNAAVGDYLGSLGGYNFNGSQDFWDTYSRDQLTGSAGDAIFAG